MAGLKTIQTTSVVYHFPNTIHMVLCSLIVSSNVRSRRQFQDDTDGCIGGLQFSILTGQSFSQHAQAFLEVHHRRRVDLLSSVKKHVNEALHREGCNVEGSSVLCA